MEIDLRRTAPDDPAALTFASALRDEVEARGADNAAARPRKPLEEAVLADIETLVAYADGRPVGTGAIRPYGAEIAEIKRMYVDPSFRGAGVANRLLEALEERARAHGYEAIRLDTHDRLVEANRLYRSRGYREIPDYNSNPRSNRWYEKRLGRKGT